MLKKFAVDEVDSHSKEGAYVIGLSMQGARWDPTAVSIEKSKVRNDETPANKVHTMPRMIRKLFIVSCCLLYHLQRHGGERRQAHQNGFSPRLCLNLLSLERSTFVAVYDSYAKTGLVPHPAFDLLINSSPTSTLATSIRPHYFMAQSRSTVTATHSRSLFYDTTGRTRAVQQHAAKGDVLCDADHVRQGCLSGSGRQSGDLFVSGVQDRAARTDLRVFCAT